MYAIVQTGGKQYRVSEGDIINVERLCAEAGAKVTLNEVLAIGDNDGMLVGKPFVEGACVSAELLENGKGEKVVIFKYKAKKDYSKKQGHRQPYSKLRIKSISAKGGIPADEPAAEGSVNLKAMKKAELVAYAQEHGIELNARATNAEMIAAIEAAM